MSYGTLTTICGPMFAGKTTELLKRVLWTQNGLSQKVAVYKSAYDTRYKITDIVSHDGLQTTAHIIAGWNGSEAQHVFFDETQFFVAPHFNADLVAIVKDLLARGINVTTAGLDSDWRGEPFTVTAQLAAMADDIIKLRSHCAVCGRPATKTYKREPNEASIELGGTDLYEPRCNTHWSGREETTLFSQATSSQAAE